MPTLELLKIGTYNGTEITPELLDEIVKNSGNRVPVVFGHGPEGENGRPLPAFSGMPSAGIVTELQRVGDSIVGDVELSPWAASQWNNFEYHNWSAGIAVGSEGAYLWHLALLGAEPPAIKDLKIISLSDHGGVVNFIETPAEKADTTNLADSEKANPATSPDSPEIIALRAENESLKGQILSKQRAEFVRVFSGVAPAEKLNEYVEGMNEAEIEKFGLFLKSLPPLIPPSPAKMQIVKTETDMKGLV